MKLCTLFAFTAVTINHSAVQAAELKPYERIQKEMDFEGFTEGDWVQTWSAITEMMPEGNFSKSKNCDATWRRVFTLSQTS